MIGGGGEVIPPHPDGTQRHHGEKRDSPLENPEANTKELQGTAIGTCVNDSS